MKKRRKHAQPMEYRMLLAVTLCLLAGGAVMVYSASSARDLLSGQGNGSGYLIRYVIYGGLGLGLMQLLARGGLEAARRLTPILLGIAFAGLVLVMAPGFGVQVNGASRWIGAGPLQFQPSELMKLALILYTAGVCTARPKSLRSLNGLGPVLLVTVGACGLVAIEPDLGTALVMAACVAALLWAAGVPARNLAILFAAGAGLVLLFALFEPYRRARLTAFLNPSADPGGAGYQLVQGQIAIGSGGLLGVGLGQSVQKVFYLPEAHTDFILAVIGEELGIAGVSVVLFLYGLIAYAGLRVARRARGMYAQLVAAGVTSLILCQATLNVFAVLGMAPLTGVPLPFVSYGSSNLVVLLGGMGLLLNIASGQRLRAVTGGRSKKGSHDGSDRDRGRRDGGPRRARAGGGRRAAL